MIAPSEQGGGAESQVEPLKDGIRRSLPGVKRPLSSANHFGVGRSGDQFGIMRMPVIWLSRDEAINLAAWLKVIADPDGKEFERLVEQIKKT